jgi:hypothetical protein
VGEELNEVLQNSSNEEYKENKHSERCNVELDKEADKIEESALQREENGRNTRTSPASCTINQTFSYKSGIEWK